MTNKYFYCYSIKLHAFLQGNAQRYICAGLNENTMRKFWQYERTETLHRLLDDWTEGKPD